MSNRNALENIWNAGVKKVGGHPSVIEALEQSSITKVDGIISIGKAATPMLEAALARSGYDTKSLLVTKYGHVISHHKFNQERLAEYQDDGTLTVIEANHPVPDENSMKAGAALVEFVGQMADDSHLLMLVSGGASALAEVLTDNVDLEALQRITKECLSGGEDIHAINARRKSMSLIKDGKLLARFSGARVTVFAISDVEGDDIGTIGSGIGMIDHIAKNIESRSEIIANNQMARTACEAKANLLGFNVCDNEETLYEDVELVAAQICQKLKNGEDGIYIFGGEPTVKLPEDPGRGGRNQQLALILSREMAGNKNIEILVAGTDGSDGPTQAAGGFVDGNVFADGEEAAMALSRADAGPYLEKQDALFTSGPTGTNVMDLVIAIKDSWD